MSSDTPMTAWQREALAGFREQQEAYLEAIAAWRRASSGATTAGAAPTPPTVPPAVPPAETGVSPDEVADANRAFMEGVLKQQQDFLEKLTRALNSHG